MNRYEARVRELGGHPSYCLNQRAPRSLSEADLIKLENELGASLPDDYREFLRDFGGYDIHFSFYGVMPGESLDLLDYHQLYHRREIMPDELVPIAVSGGIQLCIAIAGPKRGAVYFFILTEATVPASYENTELVANSFDELMQSDYLVPQ